MDCTACTEPQCLYKGALYLYLTVELYLYSPYGPYGLYRASVPVQGCILPFPYVSPPFSFYSFAFESKYSPQPCLSPSICPPIRQQRTKFHTHIVYELQLPNPKFLTLLESQYFSSSGPHPAADIHKIER